MDLGISGRVLTWWGRADLALSNENVDELDEADRILDKLWRDIHAFPQN